MKIILRVLALIGRQPGELSEFGARAIMSLANNELQFLWHLFQLYCFDGENSRALEWVASMYERCLDIPSTLEGLLLAYWEGEKESALIDAALISVQKFYFDAEQHVMLIAWLVEKGKLGIEEASSLLTFSDINPESLPITIRHVIDVAWLLNQDQKDGVMNPRQDSLLADALRNVLKETRN